MKAIQIIRGLGPIDAKNVSRDPMLRWIIGLPILVALACRLVLPAVLARLGPPLQIDLLPFYPLITSYTLLALAPMTCGMVIGFLLLDQRDDGTLAALRVTPLPLNAYLAYLLAAPMLVALPMTLVAFPVAGLMNIGLPQLLVAALAAAPLAPLAALALAAFAANKVQGFALTKLATLLLLAPAVAMLAPPGWRLIFGIVPTSWPAWLIWSLQAGEPWAWLYLPAGIICHALLLALLLRRLQTVLYR